MFQNWLISSTFSTLACIWFPPTVSLYVVVTGTPSEVLSCDVIVTVGITSLYHPSLPLVPSTVITGVSGTTSDIPLNVTSSLASLPALSIATITYVPFEVISFEYVPSSPQF